MQHSDVKEIAIVSPVAHGQSKDSAKWDVVNGMKVAVAFVNTDIEQARKKVLGVTDVSCFERYGVKGPQASQWLASRGITIPVNPNTWTYCDQKTLVLRLGSSEFLIEDQLDGSACNKLASDTARVAGVYKVPRADAAFILSGNEVLNLFSELCSLDLREKSLGDKDVVMTQVAGISATVLRQTIGNEPVYRVWCDGTYGSYLWEVLTEIAVELGGGAVGIAKY
ncbi:sarcosine oxidase, gamma subunit family [mine drainage metagenome]|uniref:Sarcosine oxidase, gamma subunit family n=1 Tax=mine drainage metagenome TaxID=410659 RepID=A0A1J5RMF1_9ZZZZ